MRFCLSICLLIIAFNSSCAEPVNQWYTQNNNEVVLKIDLFMTSTCPHCHKADIFLQELEKHVPWIQVARFVINKDKEALSIFNHKLKEHHLNDFRVPSIFFCDTRWAGFDSAQTTGKELWRAFNYCRDQIQKKGRLTPLAKEVLTRWSVSPFQIAGNESSTFLVPGMALLDAFNPCSLFGFALFLSFLISYSSRAEKLISGLLMIPVFALVHYLQQADAAAYYYVLSWLRLPALVLGLCLAVFSTRAIVRNKLHLSGYLLAPLSIFIVLFYQQTCVAQNISLFFQQWLDAQDVLVYERMAYQLIYQLFYVIPLMLLWVFSIYFLSENRTRTVRLKLQCIGLLHLFFMALILIAYPSLFASVVWSLIVILLASITGLFVHSWRLKRFG